MNNFINSFHDDERKKVPILPLIHVDDDNNLLIGQKAVFPNKVLTIDEEFYKVLNENEQHIQLSVELGSSLEEIMKSD